MHVSGLILALQLLFGLWIQQLFYQEFLGQKLVVQLVVHPL